MLYAVTVDSLADAQTVAEEMKAKKFLLFMVLTQFVSALLATADVIYFNNFENTADPLTECLGVKPIRHQEQFSIVEV
jgi:hypothetical protein